MVTFTITDVEGRRLR